MSNILKFDKARILLNGIEIGTLKEVTFTPTDETKDVYEIGKTDFKTFPYHICLECGSSWMFSTNDNKCMDCGGSSILHENFKY